MNGSSSIKIFGIANSQIYGIFGCVKIALNEHFESYVKSKVAIGDFSNTTDVVQEALSLLQKQDEKNKF